MIPAFARLMTMIVHSTQIEKPRCSAKIEKARFLRAIRRPPAAQNAASSGFQSSIQRPARRAATPVTESRALVLIGSTVLRTRARA
jgi:hypothetical protein